MDIRNCRTGTVVHSRILLKRNLPPFHITCVAMPTMYSSGTRPMYRLSFEFRTLSPPKKYQSPLNLYSFTGFPSIRTVSPSTTGLTPVSNSICISYSFADTGSRMTASPLPGTYIGPKSRTLHPRLSMKGNAGRYTFSSSSTASGVSDRWRCSCPLPNTRSGQLLFL